MKQKLELAKEQIMDNHPTMAEKTKTIVFEALDNLASIIGVFEPQNIEKIYQIEQINPSYFPGLSTAASKTILELRQGNPNLSLDFILDTVDALARRGRPWESLRAFSTFGKYCRAEISQENIEYLMNTNSNIIEIIGSTINTEMSEKKKTSNKYGNFSFLNSTPLQYDKGLIDSIKAKTNHYFPYSSRSNSNSSSSSYATSFTVFHRAVSGETPNTMPDNELQQSDDLFSDDLFIYEALG